MSDAMIAFINTTFVPVGLMLIMFSMGLTLKLGDFAQVLKNGRAPLAGLVGQLLAMPLLGLAIGILFRLPPELALGVFILGICPAGTTSNALTFIARGNVALAVVLTALSSLVTVFSIPVLLDWGITHFGLEGTAPALSIVDTMLQLARITVLPVAVGMLICRFAPETAEKLSGWLRPVSMIVLFGVIAFAVGVSAEMVLANLLGVGPALLVMNIAAMGAGLGIGYACKVSSRDAMTLAIEVGVQNVTLATFLTLTVLDSLSLAVTQNIYGVLMIVNTLVLVRWFRARRAGA
ncbi:bile acid:sodium symporter family protein [Sphingosinicella soli]|uniref:BASS family bile acid:Na+ symporter n=1 Tax=Sphingosinicella soli TaxID=333708 RepID=A0A7W7AZ03_9SPHN|nr:bile acid:sodium symporter family protein [Sphingosinicella soli]MBB4630971.1 BASS family bile acid:Na+ symporter [Sphingosinicella soli]